MISTERNEYVKYQIEKSREALKAAEILAENKLWTSVMNRLYYACFYMVNGLMVANKIETKTHSGIKNQFSLHFVKTRIIDIASGELFSDLFDWRHHGDYGSIFEIEEGEIIAHISLVKTFTDKVEAIINNTVNE